VRSWKHAEAACRIHFGRHRSRAAGSGPGGQIGIATRENPHDANARSQLIRLYFRDPQKTPVRVQHILWFVAHQPDAAVLDEPSATVNGPGEDYDHLKRAWLSRIDEPRATASTVSKAANFFRPTEPDRSIALLEKARSMEPQNWMWVAQLGQMYAFRLTGITGLNQNGLPVAVDPAKAQTKEVADLKAKLLASRDTELLGMVAAALGGQGAIAGAMTGRADETTAFSERLIERAKEVDPRNSKWDFMLGQSYAHRAEYAAGEQRAQLARRAFQHFEAARKIDPSSASAAPPSQYARVAIEAGDLKAAHDAGHRCLSQVPSLNFKDAAVHECNLILGRVALREGDTASAVRYLTAAANVSGGGSLSSFGPNMMLAKELLQKGQRQPVLEYLRLCAKFWSYDRGQIARWTAEINAGKIPEFGANLIY
jgi:hypothetical protein